MTLSYPYIVYPSHSLEDFISGAPGGILYTFCMD